MKNKYYNISDHQVIPLGEMEYSPSIMPLSIEEWQKRKMHNIRIYGYTNRIMSQLADFYSDRTTAYALLDPEGCILKLYGNPEFLSKLEADGITRGIIFTKANSGYNAVTAGNLENRTLYSFGSDYPGSLFERYVMYYSPILVSSVELSEAGMKLYGGVAMILPLEDHRQEFCETVFSITNDLSLHIQVGNLYYRLYDNNDNAMLIFDISAVSGKIFTLYHSSNLFEIFRMEPIDIYFKPVQDFIDPLPANKEFWNILDTLKKVKDHNIMISVQGRRISCIITTMPYDQPELNVSGVTMLITTPQKRSASISKHIGNNAVRTFSNIIGNSPKLKTAIRKGVLFSNSESNVMLLGESGVGKDVFAQALHNSGSRKNKPFIAVNCGALPRDLISSELFGYESGAFTGAKKQGNMGKFELANGGTLFLDEIGELPLDLQATLLRAVEQKRITRLGSSKEIEVDVRIISATNVNMQDMILQKKFRADLYYRLSTLKLRIPPLRERKDDIIALSEYFIHSVCNRIGRTDIPYLSEDARDLLLRFSWPGNVRELQNVIEATIQLFPDEKITREHLMNTIDSAELESLGTMENPAEDSKGIRDTMKTPSENSKDLRDMVDNTGTKGAATGFVSRRTKKNHQPLTAEMILHALEECGGNRTQAARYLGIGRRTLYNNMERLNMDISDMF